MRVLSLGWEDPLGRKWPLQYSCLGSPIDRGAWWTIVHGLQRAGHDKVSAHTHTQGGKERFGRLGYQDCNKSIGRDINLRDCAQREKDGLLEDRA